MANKIPRIELTKGYTISRVLKGGWQLAGGHGVIDKKTAIEDMFKFVEAGITTFDCADIYTGVEELIGQFLKSYKKKYGARRRTNVQVHTKFVPDLDILSTINKQYIEKTIDRSLRRLGVERLDLVQYHWWDYEIPRYVEGAKILQRLQKAGKIRNIGLTNFDVAHLREILESGVKVISNQVQYSLIDSRPEREMVDFCRKNNIRLLCYGSLAGGFLSESYLGKIEPKEPLENRSLVKYRLIINEFGGWELFQELLRVLSKIANIHRISITNVAGRYILDKPQVAGIILGARNAKHIEETVQIFDFDLDRKDKTLIDSVIDQARGPKGDIYSLERIKGGKHAAIMKYNQNKEVW